MLKLLFDFIYSVYVLVYAQENKQVAKSAPSDAMMQILKPQVSPSRTARLRLRPVVILLVLIFLFFFNTIVVYSYGLGHNSKEIHLNLLIYMYLYFWITFFLVVYQISVISRSAKIAR